MKQYKGIIDRFEGDLAVIEIDGITKDYDKSILPKGAQVGDMLLFKGDQISILKNETEKLRKDIEALMDELWED